MSKQRNREEAVNTQLALLISKLGVTADAETILVHGKHRPDVLFQLRGLRVVIEGKFADTPNAEEVVLGDARKRVRAGIAHIAAATIYPNELRIAPTTKILDTLSDAQLRYRIVTETFEWDEWLEGNPASVMEALRRAQESLAQDDIIEKTAKSLNIQLSGVAQLWLGQTGACDRLSTLLGIAPENDEKPEKTQERRESAAKVSALVLANALIFQEQLAATDSRVHPLRKIAKSGELVETVSSHWRWIWENINYIPVFQLGERVLDELPSSASTTSAVTALIAESKAICEQQSSLRHDLMGRIYHWLLHDAKYLGTYYTSVSAATLLSKIVFDQKWSQDFGKLEKVSGFKIADLACGTGTLLMAAAQAVTDQFIKTSAENERSIAELDLSKLHSILMQNTIHGYDILPSAVHLTASTLALLAPEVAFKQMNLFVMPIGMDHGTARMGSLDFLSGNRIRIQFSLDNTHLDSIQTGASTSEFTNASVPQLDLCVMNPPFVSSRYGNRLFGSLPDDRPKLQKVLSAQARKLGISATAGLGALFIPLADKHLKPGGRIAFVLPIALATGESWGAVRKFIAERYHLEVVISSHDPKRTNFSENTDLSEILFVARKLEDGEKAGRTFFAVLWRNATTIHEALDLATRISAAKKSYKTSDAFVTINSTSGILGEISAVSPPEGNDNWTRAIFAQDYLARVHWHIEKNSLLVLPGKSDGFSIPLCRLDELGALGYDVRDIKDAFEVDKTGTRWTPYSAFWNHDAKRVVRISQCPNAFLIARSEPIKGRKLKDANAVWDKAGNIMLVSRLRSNTHRILAAGFDTNVLGNTWWSFDDSSLSESERRVLLLWLNSSFGVLMYFGRRAITQGAWMQMKKPAWESMAVIDVTRLNDWQKKSLSGTYDELSVEMLLPISELNVDEVRTRIDDAFCKILEVPSIKSIRELLAREPGLTGREIAPDPVQFDLDLTYLYDEGQSELDI